jgi:hypothetical protein
LVLLLWPIAGGSPVRAQCSMCRSALASPEAQRLAGGLRAGIKILLVAPFAIFVLVARAALRSRRRLDAAQRVGPAGHEAVVADRSSPAIASWPVVSSNSP